jgi:hypothetical protein
MRRLLYNKTIHSENLDRQLKENAAIPVEKSSTVAADGLTTEKSGKEKRETDKSASKWPLIKRKITT